jgi:hypothetical protein
MRSFTYFCLLIQNTLNRRKGAQLLVDFVKNPTTSIFSKKKKLLLYDKLRCQPVPIFTGALLIMASAATLNRHLTFTPTLIIS